MKSFIVVTALMVAVAGVSAAAPLCLTQTTLADLIALGATGCQVQDKIFTDFAYTGSVAASNVNALAVFTTAGPQDVHGWVFGTTVGSWGTGFTLGYTISVAPGNPNVVITNAKDQINTQFSTGVTVTDTQTPNLGPSQTIATQSGSETGIIGFLPNVTSVTTSTTVTVPSGSSLQSLEQDFLEQTNATTTTPEPASYGLLGAGFLMLGWMRFKKA